jgi:hypothetical protein
MAQQIGCSGPDLVRARRQLAHDVSSVLGTLAATATIAAGASPAGSLRELIDNRTGF